MSEFISNPQTSVNDNLNFNYHSNENPKDFIFKKHKAMRRVFDKILRGLPSSYRAFAEYILDAADNKTDLAIRYTETIAKEIGYSVRQVKRASAYCHDMNIIHKIQRGKKLANIYTINYDLANIPIESPIPSLKGHDDVTSISSASSESKQSNYNNNSSKIEKIEGEQSEDITSKFIKEFKAESFWPSKKNYQLLENMGYEDYLRAVIWIKSFREILKRQKPWNGDEVWDFGNANYAFEKFIRHEIPLKKKLGELKYIEQWKRHEFKNKAPKLEEKTDEIVERQEVDILAKYEHDLELKEFMEKIVNQYGQASFKSWVYHLDLECKDDKIWRFKIHSRFIRGWIVNNYLPFMESIKPGIKMEIIWKN